MCRLVLLCLAAIYSPLVMAAGTAQAPPIRESRELPPPRDTLFVEQPPGSGTFRPMTGVLIEIGPLHLRLRTDSGEYRHE